MTFGLGEQFVGRRVPNAVSAVSPSRGEGTLVKTQGSKIVENRRRRRVFGGPSDTLLGRDFWLHAIIGSVVLSTFVMAFVEHPARGTNGLWFSRLCVVASALPIIPMLTRARRSPALGTAWRLMAMMAALNTTALLIHIYHDKSPWPSASLSLGDAVFLVSAVAFVVGLALLTQVKLRPVESSTRLDSAIAGLAAASVAGAFWLEPLLHPSGGPLRVFVELTYPLCGLAMIGVVFAGWILNRHRANRTTSLLLMGGLCWIVGYDFYLHERVTNTHAVEAVVVSTMLAGVWIISLAASVRDRRLSEARVGAGLSLISSMVPVLSGVISLGVIAATWHRFGRSPVGALLAFVALILVICRMWITLREESSLVTSTKADARTDSLTGLPNRRSLLEEVESTLGVDGQNPTGVILIDLDGFKEINDSLGHLAGDELLCVVGMRFQSVAIGRGVLGRLGGDEFAFVAPTNLEQELIGIARELLATLSGPHVLDGVSIHVGASMGVSVSTTTGSTAVELIRGADVAMYESKRMKAGVSVYRTNNDPNSREQLGLLADLRSAIEAETLTVLYQPTLDMRTGLVRGVEALVRWEHPELGMVYPETFIPMTERAGLMPQLTRAILVQAIAEAGRLDRLGHRLQMSVNISRYDLLDGELPDFIGKILSFHAFPAGRLTIEITESSLGSDPDRAARCVRNLRNRGIRISIDDYGVGYSSMSQLLDLSIDEIKIDKSFIVGLCSDSRAQAIVRSAVELARALGLSLVTEGIESEEVLQSLQLIGADIGQGFYIARPLARQELDDYLVSQKSAVRSLSDVALFPVTR
jgi:diguanylate cyclase (GGDEF)-like protein